MFSAADPVAQCGADMMEDALEDARAARPVFEPSNVRTLSPQALVDLHEVSTALAER